MRKLLLLLPLITLLTACQSKKDICARWAVGETETYEAAKQLRITPFRPEDTGYWVYAKVPPERQESEKKVHAFGKTYKKVRDFCDYYKN